MAGAPAIRIGFVLFENLTQLDLTGPWEVLTRVPGAQALLLAHDLKPVMSQNGLAIVPTATFDGCGKLDIAVVPGGPGHLQAMQNDKLLDFLREQGAACRYVCAVCTGSLVLAAAGLLRGYRATSHWMSVDRLAAFGAMPQNARVVIDRDRVTGGGVTAGIDFGLTLAAELAGEEWARAVQLQIEYAPQPPFDSGSPETAAPKLVERVRRAGSAYREQMEKIDRAAAAKLRLRQKG